MGSSSQAWGRENADVKGHTCLNYLRNSKKSRMTYADKDRVKDTGHWKDLSEM
jgi:hypothetical protein